MPDKTNDFKAHLPRVHRSLARWYEMQGRRDLPWRSTRDPYAIYVSEIMLQQTQVKTVLERYYHPFLVRFPTLAVLAKAKREEVMKAWEGLGYYSRAANLHKAAAMCKGKLPKTVEGLLALPGIGRNTAQAVACFAFGQSVAVMEANVKRVICRVFAIEKPDEKILWQRAGELLDTKHPFDYNQAMMDVGAMICTKRKPRCGICPLNTICRGQTRPEAYPEPKQSKKVPVRKHVIVVPRDEKGRYYLLQRKTRFLGGLYGFVECEQNAASVELMGRRYSLAKARVVGSVIQSYSHFTLDARVYMLPVKSALWQGGEGFQRVTLDKITHLPLSRADLKIVGLLTEICAV